MPEGSDQYVSLSLSRSLCVADYSNILTLFFAVDPESDVAVGTMAQLLLQENKVPQALEYFERAAELGRTEGEIVNAISYAEATRTQLEVQERYPKLAARAGMGM